MDDDRLDALVREMARLFLDEATWSYDGLDPRLQALCSGGEFSTLVALGNGRVRIQRNRNRR